MLIILESNEGGGKTSIGNKLISNHSSWLLCKRWTHKTDVNQFGFDKWDLREAFFYDWRFFLEMLTFNNAFDKQTFVCDRSFITDYVFNLAIWPEHMTDKYMQYWAAYNKQLKSIPHLILYCKREVDRHNFDDVAMHNWHMDIEHWQRIENAYRTWRNDTELNVLDIDNNIFSIDDNIQYIEQYLDTLKS